MPQLRVAAALLSLGLALSPAAAITRQSPPHNADGSSRLVDPDEQADRMSDQSRRGNERAARRDMRDHRHLVAPSGPAASFEGLPY